MAESEERKVSIIAAALPVIVSLVIMEGLMSVDNAMGIASMVQHLPKRQKKLAIRAGMLGAYLLRGLALACAGFLMAHSWIKMIGAAYLLWLALNHFRNARSEGKEDTKTGSGGFWRTVIAVEIMDFSLSIDNVVVAVALSPHLWVVITGVFIGIAVMRFVAGACVSVMERHPVLEHTAFLLIGFVGVQLLVQELFQLQISEIAKFAGIAVIIALSLVYESFKQHNNSAALRASVEG